MNATPGPLTTALQIVGLQPVHDLRMVRAPDVAGRQTAWLVAAIVKLGHRAVRIPAAGNGERIGFCRRPGARPAKNTQEV